MWYQTGKKPGPLPSVVTNTEGQSVSNPGVYPESTLNSWGWKKCEDVKAYDSLYYHHSWSEPNWVYTPYTYEERAAKITAKKEKFIGILRRFYREARAAELADGVENTKLKTYLTDITTEIARIDGLLYGDASIDDTLKDINNEAAAKTTDANTENNENEETKNSIALDFWYNYHTNSMPVQQRGGIGLV